MAKRQRGPDDLPLNWRGGRHREYSDPTVTSVSLNGPGAFGGGSAPPKRRRAGPSAFDPDAPLPGPRVELEQLEPAQPSPPRANGRIKLQK
ncbi:MAG: hypothetical protein H6741_04805 [Alphaproteobacteria bacterium]|nr:hypothetical protein [Alphaproteobacteria bacterium]MCB9792028.1 hypothetical protein [Alphaproteobacteria bacterium]